MINQRENRKKLFLFFLFLSLSACFDDSPQFTSNEMFKEKINQVYVLNLDSSIGDSQYRWKRMQKQLQQKGFAFERFPATYGQWLDLENLEKEGLLQYRVEAWDWPYAPAHKLFPSEVGCYWSHRAIAEDLIRRNFSAAMVLEDDVTLVEDFEERLNPLLACVPSDWDIIFLGCNGAHGYGCLSGDLESICQGRLSLAHNCTPGTYGYLISKQGARKLVEASFPIIIPIDELIGRRLATGQFGPFKAYCTNPELVQHLGHFNSIIGEERT